MKYVTLGSLTLAGVLAVTGMAHAQLTPVSPTGSNFITGASVPWVPMAEWERDGGMSSSAAGDDQVSKAPANAMKYRAKTFTFPTGTIRILEFKKSDGGVLHQVTFETEMYVVKGSATVGVHGTDEALSAGDAVNLPSGFLRSKPGAAEDTTVILFTVKSSEPASVSTVVRAKDATESAAAARPAEPGSPAVGVKFYRFDGNSIRIATSKAPGVTKPYTGKTDAILYMLSGRMQLTDGDEVKSMQAGDAVREAAGLATNWDVTEDSVFIATTAPYDPHPVK